MKKYLHLEVPPLHVDEETQKAFCTSAKKCVDKCEECIYDKSNLELFKQRFKELEK